ncbi:MAG: hypothetical protein CO063_03185, partial [Candidatus Altarchaeum sp. CG_4_9_14_0_8_um_filter_32_206]
KAVLGNDFEISFIDFLTRHKIYSLKICPKRISKTKVAAILICPKNNKIKMVITTGKPKSSFFALREEKISRINGKSPNTMLAIKK